MKKLFIASVLFLGANYSIGQEQNTGTTTAVVSHDELFTSVRPADGVAYVFSSQEDLNAAVPAKIEKIKAELVKNQDNAELVKFYKEELWRFENAIVKSNN